MQSDTHTLDAVLAQQLLAEASGERPSVFEAALGLRPSTGSIKVVHIMNDLAQCAMGGMPSHKGELLCRIIRQDNTSDKEDNRDEVMRRDPRWGAAYSATYPLDLGEAKIRQLRAGAEVLLNFDGGMYAPGDNMASGLATHWTMLGAEGFRRFRVGGYLAALLGLDGVAQLKALFTTHDQDPVTRALAPLRFPMEFAPAVQREEAPLALQPFDEALGRGLRTLMQQPLSKLTVLRLLALAGSLGVVLKIYGVGRPHGRPALLALPAEDRAEMRPLREAAVQSLNRAVDALDQRFARDLSQHPGWGALCGATPRPGAPSINIQAPRGTMEAAQQVLRALRAQKGKGDGEDGKTIYWPDKFAEALGKKIGAVGPKADQAGWSKHMTLTPDLMEALVLMYVPAGSSPLRWQALWARVRDDLGLVVGADEHADAVVLREAGVLHVNRDDLGRNNDIFLRQAVRRGIARRLPDSGAEAGGELR
jgi:hypothetical protein